jgi:hypothetical protein
MALRRLFSGWLIAMAALARSVAQALERASEDRSASTPDPVMAALAERYPGAPVHWLAHVAERTSQLAEAGDVPLSLNSDPAVWPPTRPGASPPSVEAMERAAVSHRPAPPRPATGREAAAPTLAALRERPSEVWRRPDAAPRRRPRPVFASPASPSAPEPSTRAASAMNASAPPSRPRSPLSVKARSPSPARSETSPALSVSETVARPEVAGREAPWSDAPRSRAATPAIRGTHAGGQASCRDPRGA